MKIQISEVLAIDERYGWVWASASMLRISNVCERVSTAMGNEMSVSD